MTERCQTKFKEKFEYQNNVFLFGILLGALAVLYFYRFHFATLAFSYALGCVACYYGLNSRILHNYVEQLKCHFVRKPTDEECKNDDVKGCETCGSNDCSRHNATDKVDPWVGLQVHKQLDQAIEDFYNTILEQFVSSWGRRVSPQPFFVDELRHQLRRASAHLLRRARRINYARFLTTRVTPCVLRHYARYRAPGALSGALEASHPAAANRNAELKYLRAVANAIMPYLLKDHEVGNSIFRTLSREIFSGWALLPLTDALADPYIVHTLLLLAVGDETPAALPATPNYTVEFLETFVRQTDSIYCQRPKLLKIDVDYLLNDQEHFYALMQYMKTSSHINLLQFYKDIKSFQTRILNPELSASEVCSLHAEASSLRTRYFSTRVAPSPPALVALGEELAALPEDPQSVIRLQTSRALYQAARQTHAELEKNILPKFLHSEEYYKLLIGSRVPTGFHKHMTKKSHDKLIHTALRLGNKIKGVLKTQAIDGQVLDCFMNAEVCDGDSGENIDILKYFDALAAEDLDKNLSTYKVVLTDVETRMQAPPRRGSVRVFTLVVHVAACGTPRIWHVVRSEHDFHLLRAKLHEFHGDRLLHDLPLPSRRDNSPLETLRYKYEDFIQRLLRTNLLQTSELLHLFLTCEGEFSLEVQASTLNANSTDLGNIYQSVTHKLRKEKGQHLENFLKNYLISSDIDRYQALKQGTSQVEEAQEVSEEIEIYRTSLRSSGNARNIHSTIFGNNFNKEPVVRIREVEYQNVMTGFSQCVMFLLIKVLHARTPVTGVVGAVLGTARDVLDTAWDTMLGDTLARVLCERRLAHLIRLGHALLFNKKVTITKNDPTIQREQALKQLLEAIPPSAKFLIGPGLTSAVHTAFDIIQSPQLNKELVYNLLDLCLLELFPELSATEK